MLVFTPFEENAKRVESHLRNAGHKVRAEWIKDLAALEAQLQRATPDLLIAAHNNPEISLRTVVETSRRFSPDLPVLGLAAEMTGELTAAAVATGARDLVADGSPESLAHLEKVYVREFIGHRNHRELARARSLLTDYESRYTQLLEGTGDAVAHIYEGILSQVNPAFASLLGYDDDAELAGMPMMDVVASDHQADVREHLKLVNKGDADGQTLYCGLAGKNGDVVMVSAQLTRGEAEGENFIELLIRAESSRPNAGTNTTSSGRRDFFAAIDAPSDNARPRAALFVRIDLMDELEERIGLIDSELIAGKVVEALLRRLNADDRLHVLSSCEFGICVTRKDAHEFEKLGENLVKELSTETFTASDVEASLTVSICVYPIGASETAGIILKELASETRLVSQKGGNRCCVLGDTAQSSAQERESGRKAEAIREAIEQGRLKLAYQTIASLEGDPRQHFDVLVRMVNEDGVELHASDFIRTAEKAGLMRSIDRWVVSRAVKILSSREESDDHSMLFLKLSEDTLKDCEAFLSWFSDLTKDRKIGKDEICFEFQEVVAQNHIRKARLLAQTLRDAGANVAIEHFGIGSASARTVEHLPVNFLKFHSSFTHRFEDSEIQKKMSDLMEIAKQRRIKTIVSHVEDANVMARMWQMGINYIQGYHVQEPEVVMLT